MGQKLTDRPSDYTFGKRKLRWPWLIAAGTGALVLIGIGGYLTFRGSAAQDDSANTNSELDTPTLVSRQLDGVLVESEKSNHLPLMMVVENHTSVRPQSGLSKAGVVYEALAEGGITRFLAIFAVNGTLNIGPIRSARPYFVQIARAYNGVFVHAGQSTQAAEQITKTKIIDFNQFYKKYNFYNISGRAQEHSLFTNLHLMELGWRAMKLKDRGDYESWSFKDEAPVATPTTKPIVVDFSTASYRVSYTYDTARNVYKRSQGGTVATDKESGAIEPKNVAIMFTTSKLFDKLRRDIVVVGEGKLLLFRDGEMVTGTWKKSLPESQLQLLDSAGAVLQLNRGQTWVEVVDLPEKYVTY
ncbi:MAG: DUF3048 domain-containing protein [bacterium]|nr:DUF3048 domain-containing protein [bacterium]